MNAIVDVVLVSLLAFVGTTCDDFFAFGAQLVLTETDRWRRVSYAQALAVATVVAIALGVGTALRSVPLHWLGLLCLAPFAFAAQSWRRRASPHPAQRRGTVTTFALTLGISGDNLAVWIPLLHASDMIHVVATLITFALAELAFLGAARTLARHPRVATWGAERASRVVWLVYALLGVLILVECHVY